jgi:hypothetical protein
VAAFAAFLILLFASALPQVEDPIPERVGLGFPFAAAGAGGVLGGVICAASPPAKRERAMRLGVLIGFALGAALYLLALVVQVGLG